MDRRRQDLFARAKSLLRDVPPPRPPWPLVLSATAAAAMLVYSLVMLLRWLDMPDLIVFGLGSIVTWFIIVGGAGRRALVRLTGALDRSVVVIVDKRIDTVADEPLCILTVENEHGDRVEHVVSPDLYTASRIDEVGILFTKHGRVWGFHRVSLA